MCVCVHVRVCVCVCVFRSVKALARLSLKDPAYVSVHEHAQYSTPSGLEQVHILTLTPPVSRLVL